MLQQRLQIIGATKNEQMVISILPYITLYHAIHSQHASRKSFIFARPVWFEPVHFPLLNQLSRTLEFFDVFMFKNFFRKMQNIWPSLIFGARFDYGNFDKQTSFLVGKNLHQRSTTTLNSEMAINGVRDYLVTISLFQCHIDFINYGFQLLDSLTCLSKNGVWPSFLGPFTFKLNDFSNK